MSNRGLETPLPPPFLFPSQELAACASLQDKALVQLRDTALNLLSDAPPLLRQARGEGDAVDETTLQATCYGECLLYLLDSLALLSVQNNTLAKELLPPLHELASAIQGLNLKTPSPPSKSRPSPPHPLGRSADVIESPHPLPPYPSPTRQTISLPGSTHLSVVFDGSCATFDFDSVSVELPAPPLPPGWSLEAEVGPLAEPQLSKGLDAQARRAEYEGEGSTAYSLYLTLFAGGREAEHLLCAARVALEQLHHPHKASPLSPGPPADPHPHPISYENHPTSPSQSPALRPPPHSLSASPSSHPPLHRDSSTFAHRLALCFARFWAWRVILS